MYPRPGVIVSRVTASEVWLEFYIVCIFVSGSCRRLCLIVNMLKRVYIVPSVVISSWHNNVWVVSVDACVSLWVFPSNCESLRLGSFDSGRELELTDPLVGLDFPLVRRLRAHWRYCRLARSAPGTRRSERNYERV